MAALSRRLLKGEAVDQDVRRTRPSFETRSSRPLGPLLGMRIRANQGRETAMSDVAGPQAKKYQSFAAFYPFYLSEHADRTCRRLHFVGSTLALLCLVTLIVTQNPWWLLAGVICGYGFAWIGHFAFEKNQPASFKQPLYSFMGDWKMYWQILTGKIAF
jgi:hypothetical protein